MCAFQGHLSSFLTLDETSNFQYRAIFRLDKRVSEGSKVNQKEEGSNHEPKQGTILFSFRS